MEVVVISILLLITLLVLGVPVPFCFVGALAFLGLSTGMDMGQMMSSGFYSLSSVTLLAIGAFILVGGLLNTSGIADRLVRFAETLVGWIKGGLGASSVFACAIMGAIAGTCSAAVAAIGTIMIPRMEERGYPRGYSAALVACASVLGQLIPPSVPMILFGFVLKLSVVACFLSTVGPGLILVGIYMFINWFLTKRMPTLAKPTSIGAGQWIKNVGHATYQGSWALLMPIVVLGSIYGGIATPTEAATVACAYAVLVGFFIYKGLSLKKLYGTIVSMGVTTAVIVLMLYFVMILSRLYTYEMVPQHIATGMMAISQNKYVVLVLVNLFLILIGMLMDDASGTLLAAPLLFPIVQAIGVNPYHFAAIMGTNLGLGNVTPPCAPILYLAGRVGGVTIDKMIKTALIFMFCGGLPVVLITTYWPDLSLFLPRLLMPNVVH